MCPYSFIDSMVGERQRDGDERPALRPLHASEFPPPTAAQIAAYGHDALVAVRANDLAALRDLHRDGGPDTLGCRNQFGESLLHAACRRADAAVVAFLLDEAGASPLVMDDYGRTPLHDACWRGKPAFAVVEALLRAEPRLAYVADVRGHRPFQYARREHWGVWNQFLAQKRDLIL
jgi:ankyrin repeat protein